MADSTKESREVGELTITVSADVGDAITGFKALQRELRETTKVARELEQAYKDAEKAINGLAVSPRHSDKQPSTYSLQIQAIKDDLASRGDKGADTALALIEEQEREIAEFERRMSVITATEAIRRSYD